MIDRKELRLGNLVKYGHSDPNAEMEICEVLGIKKGEHGDNDLWARSFSSGELWWEYFDEFVHGIQLSSELLSKIEGFDKEHNTLNLPDTPDLECANAKHYLQYDFMESEIGIRVEPQRPDIKGTQIWITCKYLHQLQNLYFCLSGNELKLNNKL